MAGVLYRGQQWERCNNCGEFVPIQNLRYEPKSDKYPYGRDLCAKCAKRGSQD